MSAINEKAVNGTQLQRTHKKIYRHLMPLLIVAYIISFIDRTNIGMAKATMSVDIGLSATAFGLGAGLFFLTYAVLEIPSNLFLTRIGARRWIARIMITWGILSCGMAFVTGPTSFYVMRLLLGAPKRDSIRALFTTSPSGLAAKSAQKPPACSCWGSVWPILSARRWADCY